jgi:hypothetical protein
MKLVSDQEFWSDVYRGRRIAVFNQRGRWHAYLDHAHQPNIEFATAEHAVRWLAARIDGARLQRAA